MPLKMRECVRAVRACEHFGGGRNAVRKRGNRRGECGTRRVVRTQLRVWDGHGAQPIGGVAAGIA